MRQTSNEYRDVPCSWASAGMRITITSARCAEHAKRRPRRLERCWEVSLGRRGCAAASVFALSDEWRARTRKSQRGTRRCARRPPIGCRFPGRRPWPDAVGSDAPRHSPRALRGSGFASVNHLEEKNEPGRATQHRPRAALHARSGCSAPISDPQPVGAWPAAMFKFFLIVTHRCFSEERGAELRNCAALMKSRPSCPPTVTRQPSRPAGSVSPLPEARAERADSDARPAQSAQRRLPRRTTLNAAVARRGHPLIATALRAHAYWARNAASCRYISLIGSNARILSHVSARHRDDRQHDHHPIILPSAGKDWLTSTGRLGSKATARGEGALEAREGPAYSAAVAVPGDMAPDLPRNPSCTASAKD